MVKAELLFDKIAISAERVTAHAVSYRAGASGVELPRAAEIVFADGARQAVSSFSGHDVGKAGKGQIGEAVLCAFTFEIPHPDGWARVSEIKVRFGEDEQTWAAADFSAKRHRWLFHPIPIRAQDLALDVRNYSTRIADRRVLFDYSLAASRRILEEQAAGVDPGAISQLVAVLCYRLLDAPRLATEENTALVRLMMAAFRAAEASTTVHWSLSIRYAYAQFMMRYGAPEEALTALEEMQPLGPLTRDSYQSIYNYVKCCLLLGSIYLLRRERPKAKSAFENAIDLTFYAPSVAPRSFAMTRELSEMFKTCALCIAGIDAIRGGTDGTHYYQAEQAIKSTFRFKNEVEIGRTAQRAIDMFGVKDK